MIDHALDVPNLSAAKWYRFTFWITVAGEVEDAVIEAHGEYTLCHGQGFEFGSVVSMKVDEAILFVIFLPLVKGHS